MKKGFTLVELAIVLVIIGIVVALAVKGKQLFYVAQIQKEIVTLKKMEAAMMTYVDMYGPLPDNSTDSIPDMSLFDNIIPPKERFSKLTNARWVYARCSLSSSSDSNLNYSNWGDTVGYMSQTTSHHQFCVLSEFPYARADFVCNIERNWDDGTLNFGNGRAQNGGNSDVTLNLEDCSKTSTDLNIVYAWKIGL